MTHRVYADPRYRAARKHLKTWDHTCHAQGCGYPIDMQLTYPHPLSWSCDHKVPKSKLTPGDPRHWHESNLQAMHLRCNEARGNKNITPPTPLNW